MKEGFSTLALTFILGTLPVWAATPQVCHQDYCVSVQVVSKPQDMERGLMFRKILQKDTGMFFVFAQDDLPQFWMKNMNFDLDLVWINHEGRIVFISRNVPACKKDPCPVYAPDHACRYVLELASGTAAAHGWKNGDSLLLTAIPGIIKK